MLRRALGGRKPCIPRPPTWAPQARPPGLDPRTPAALPHRAPCPPDSQQPRAAEGSCLSTTGPSWTPRESCGPELRPSALLGHARGAPGPPSPTHDTRAARTSPRGHPPNHPHTPTHTHATPWHPTCAHTQPQLRSPAPRDRAHAARAGKPSAKGPVGPAESSRPRERRCSAAPAPDDRPRWVGLGFWPGLALAAALDQGEKAGGA